MDRSSSSGLQKPLWSTLAVRQGLRGSYHGLELLVNAFLYAVYDLSGPHFLIVTTQLDGQLDGSSDNSDEPSNSDGSSDNSDELVPHFVHISPILPDGGSMSCSIPLDTAVATNLYMSHRVTYWQYAVVSTAMSRFSV